MEIMTYQIKNLLWIYVPEELVVKNIGIGNYGKDFN